MLHCRVESRTQPLALWACLLHTMLFPMWENIIQVVSQRAAKPKIHIDDS